MKVLLQSLKNGECFLENVPVPKSGKGSYVVQSNISLVSTGTEKMLLKFGQSSWYDKIKQQPDKVSQVLDKIKNEGFAHTISQVKLKLDQPIPLGYCNVGVIVESHYENELKCGDRIVCNGSHAEFNLVPNNLCVKIPDSLSDEEAVFAIPGAIAMQGIRLVAPQIGEKIVVIGLGLIGILTSQILHANGCEVIALDISEEALSHAKKLGITCYNSSEVSAQQLFDHYYHGLGADAVIITASTDKPLLSDAASLCRQRGKVVLVGVIGSEFNRDAFYKKEISFQVACSYGPGRYDPQYEEKGIDYPYGLVRWTEKRNIESVLRLIENKRIDVTALIQNKVSFEEAPIKLYKHLDNLKLANLISYNTANTIEDKKVIFKITNVLTEKPVIGILGSGQFTQSVILPSLKKSNAQIKCIQSRQSTLSFIAKKFNIAEITSDSESVLKDPAINTVIISTRHATHGALCLKALEYNKAVFIEKPLCIHKNELDEIERKVKEGAMVKVGFNRCYSSHIQKIKKYLAGSENALCINYTINAGYIDSKHWIQDPQQGGRILGELCHFVDLCIFLTQSKVKETHAIAMGPNTHLTNDNLAVQLKFHNGSIASIQYFANGHKKQDKEDLKIFFAGKIIHLENFKKLSINGTPQSVNLFTGYDKGHAQQFEQLIQNPEHFFNIDDMQRAIHTTRVCFDIVNCLQHGDK